MGIVKNLYKRWIMLIYIIQIFHYSFIFCKQQHFSNVKHSGFCRICVEQNIRNCQFVHRIGYRIRGKILLSVILHCRTYYSYFTRPQIMHDPGALSIIALANSTINNDETSVPGDEDNKERRAPRTGTSM